MNRKHLIYVENISPTSKEEHLIAYLDKWAPVLAVYFLREKQCTKRSVAAFVRMGSEADVEAVLTRNLQNYRGKRLFMVRADVPQFYQADLTVIVRNIMPKISEENLYEHFEECGQITFIQVRTDDFAYVAFQDKANVRNAMTKNNMPLKNANLKIQVLTRNLEIMIVNLDTLHNKMPELYRKMCVPVEPRSVPQRPPLQVSENMETEPLVEQQPTPSVTQVVQNQPLPKQTQMDWWAEQQKQRNNQQTQQQQQRQQPQQQQQRQQQQQPQQQQQRQQPQHQQQRQQPPQQQPLPQRQQPQAQPISAIQLLKEKANAFAGKQQPGQSNGSEPQKPVVQEPVSQVTTTVIIDDEPDVEIVEEVPLPPIPSKYKPMPGDIMRPVKASEISLSDADVKNPSDRCAVWINNLQPETRRLDIITYLEQFGAIENFKVGTSKNCFFTRWAKVVFTNQEGALKASEYFLHPFQGRYLFVLACTRCVDEVPGRCFVIDYLSKYTVYEDVVKAFKHVGEVFYLARLYDNSFKVRIFFVNDVNAEAVVAVKSIDGFPVNLEKHVKDMVLKIPKGQVKLLKEGRDVINSDKAARIARIVALNKEEAEERCAPREYTNPNSATSPVEILIHNVPTTCTDGQITEFLKDIGKPTSIRREPGQFDPTERVYVGFTTLSHALRATRKQGTLAGNRLFIFTAWTTAAMTDRNTIQITFAEPISVQDIYTGMGKYGAVHYVQKESNKQALVVFAGTDCINTILKAKDAKNIGRVQIVGTGRFAGKHQKPSEAPIVIDDEDEVVVVPSESPAKNTTANGQKNQPQQQQQKQQKQQQPQRQQQQQKGGPQQQQNRPPGKKVRNPFSDNQNQQQQRGPPQQQRQMNPWANNNFNNDGPMRQFDRNEQQFQRNNQFMQDDRFNQNDQFQRNNQMMQNNQFNQNDRFDQFDRERNMNQMMQQQFNNFQPQFDNFKPQFNNFQQQQQQFNNFQQQQQFDDFGQQQQFNNFQQQQFDNFRQQQFDDNFPQQNDNRFNQGPMDCDDPPLDRWGGNNNRFSPPRDRSPFDPRNRGQGGDGWGNESPDIPSNIPEHELDEYISRKQQAIQRRLDQLDKQLISSVESSRDMHSNIFSRRRKGTHFDDNGDVQYVPNPAARGRGQGRNRGGRNNRGDGNNRNRSDADSTRTRDPFAGLNVVPIIRISEDRSPSPKRNRGGGGEEDDFDTDRFNAAWC